MNLETGFATISDLARHMQVCWATAAKVATKLEEEYGLKPAKGPTIRYCWEDIWVVEGYSDVAPNNWRRMKAPLLRTKDIADAKVYGHSERTIHRRAQEGTLKSIKLPIIGHRFHEFEIEAELL